MTAEARENQQAAAAQAAGEAASDRHLSDAAAQHAISGSTTATEAAATPDAHSVQWSNADTSASPSLSPSTPRPVGEQRQHDGPPAA
jgi:hypothetical protein